MLNKLIAVNVFLAAVIASLAACTGDDGRDGRDGSDGVPGSAGEDGQDAVNTAIALSFLGRYETNTFDKSAAEIVAYDAANRQAFVVNAHAGLIDIIDISTPTAPSLVGSLNPGIDIAAALDSVPSADNVGAANSVAVSDDTVAVAVAAAIKQDNGYVAFYQTDGTFLTAVAVGPLPDMVIYSPDGTMVLTANEGEPNADYTVDPEGSVSVIDVSGGEAALTQAQVTTIPFTDFNAGGARAAELSEHVRISAKAQSVAQDLEPEYIAISADSTSAWVALQENNAVAVLDLPAAEVATIIGLGAKNHEILGNELDASNRDGSINIRNWPLKGLYMPDSIDVYEYGGTRYLVSANEGDAREYLSEAADEAACRAAGGFNFDDGDCFHYLDEIRLADIEGTGATIDLENLGLYAPDIASLAANENLGRIKIVADQGVSGCAENTFATTGLPSAGCAYEELYVYGARSFSIWNAETGALVFDSGNDFEVIAAQRLGEEGFNASNDENGGDDRSDDKGPEPEAIEIAVIGAKTYAFIGLERVGGIMVYDITNPEAAFFVQYMTTRDTRVNIAGLVDAGNFQEAGDLGPESIVFIAAADSPNGQALILVGNEVSGTTAIFQVTEIASKP